MLKINDKETWNFMYLFKLTIINRMDVIGRQRSICKLWTNLIRCSLIPVFLLLTFLFNMNVFAYRMPSMANTCSKSTIKTVVQRWWMLFFCLYFLTFSYFPVRVTAIRWLVATKSIKTCLFEVHDGNTRTIC